MFCYQCEQTLNYPCTKPYGCRACTQVGACGKSPEVAALQDLLVYAVKCVALLALELNKRKVSTAEIDAFICKILFSTVTNVNFDQERIYAYINETIAIRDKYLKKLKNTKLNSFDENAAYNFKFDSTLPGMIQQGKEHGLRDKNEKNENILALKHTVLFGIKGIASHAYHAKILGKQDEKIYKFIKKALAATLSYDKDLNYWLDMMIECGQISLRTIQLLDAAHIERYGDPVPTKVPLGCKKGKAILVSGHDLKDLELLLEQTKDKNINIYTHGEMLPAHGYPELKKYKHFCGHYGTAWQNQHKEFGDFPGAILMTTNCLQNPLSSYKNNIFTSGVVGWSDVEHIESKDFTPVINKALEMEGFTNDSDQREIQVGYGHHAFSQIIGKLVDNINAGKIKHIFLVGGCDGAKPGRNYYTEFVEAVPEDCIILTLACGKFRFFDKNLGEIEGIPRLLDIGQCNDAYSAVQILTMLAKALNTDINNLPLSIVFSWYEQKMVAILLAVLSLGIKNFYLGPSLPAFFTFDVYEILKNKYNIQPIATPAEDLAEMLEA